MLTIFMLGAAAATLVPAERSEWPIDDDDVVRANSSSSSVVAVRDAYRWMRSGAQLRPPSATAVSN